MDRLMQFANVLFSLATSAIGIAALPMLIKFKRHHRHPKTAVNLFISLTKLDMTQILLPSATASLTGVDANGLATTQFPGDVVWSISDPTLFSIAPAADGLTVVVTPLGVTGTATLSVTSGPLTASVEVSFQAVVVEPPPPPPPPTPGVAVALSITLTQN